MKIIRGSAGLAAMAALCLFTLQAQAVPIPGIFNTGVDPFAFALPDDAPDPHWTIVAAPAPLVTPLIPEVVGGPGPVLEYPGAAPNAGPPFGCRWISPNTDLAAAGEGPVGEYVYELLFDLTGLDPDTAVIGGVWVALDSGPFITLNGFLVPVIPPADAFAPLTPFFFSAVGGADFLPGINSVRFHVINPGAADSDTGVQVQITGTADPLEQVPEPSTLILLGIGLAGLCAARLRMRKGSSAK